MLSLVGTSPNYAAEEQSRKFDSVFEVYQSNRERGIPNLVTPDLALLGYSGLMRKSILKVESEIVKPGLESLLLALRDQLLTEIKSKAGDSQVTNRNREYIELLTALLTGQPGSLTDTAADEYELDRTG